MQHQPILLTLVLVILTGHFVPAGDLPDSTAAHGIPCTLEGLPADSDRDGVPDTDDCDNDNDGILDAFEQACAPLSGDSDGDTVPDWLDLDSDNDGIHDVTEAGGLDLDHNALADGTIASDGLASSAQDGLSPTYTGSVVMPDYLTLDSDQDGTFDLVEHVDMGRFDADKNGRLDGPDSDQDGIPDVTDRLPFTRGDGPAIIATNLKPTLAAAVHPAL